MRALILPTPGDLPGGRRRRHPGSTGEYKIKSIKRKIRELLGYPYPQRIPKDVFVEQWVGTSTDEFHRAKGADVRYMRNRHPLIDMGWSRSDCILFSHVTGPRGHPEIKLPRLPYVESSRASSAADCRGSSRPRAGAR
ncbi:hypothetical protein ACH4HG_16310 [Streptomyces coeruleorubidus]|uniref:hypothetical protein n=1 Tax=Streptomyces coeruleorubidus TaxID=116188 RepID=UPI0037B4715A